MREKKCGIITYHFAMNYGSVLQCFALKKYIEGLGIDVQVFDFVSNEQQDNNSLYRKNKNIKSIGKNLILSLFHEKRKRRKQAFESFVKSQILSETSHRIKNVHDLETEVNQNKFDYIISGSDQVWNPNIYDFNDAFFYPFETKAKKLGYAVSTREASTRQLTPYAKWIKDFAAVTARDNKAQEVLAPILGMSIPLVCDPVFLVDKQMWCEQIKRVRAEKYLFCYLIKKTEKENKVKLAESIAKEKGLSLVILSAQISKFNITKNVVSDAGPLDFISYIANADYICTDSFHGTSFSLIFNKEFTVFHRKSEESDARIRSLLVSVGADQRLHYLDEPWGDKQVPTYDYVNKKIKQIQCQSRDILGKMLEL